PSSSTRRSWRATPTRCSARRSRDVWPSSARPPSSPMRLVLVLALAGCGAVTDLRGPWDFVRTHDVGRPILGFPCKRTADNHTAEHLPQEFADVAIAPVGPVEANEGRGAVYIGSHGGQLYALSPGDGHELWKREVGSVSGEPVIGGDLLFVGNDDGMMT